jgi:hypothetical protein
VSPLTGTKYLWPFGAERLPAERTDAFAAMQALNLKVWRTWAITEALPDLWTHRQGAAVRRFFFCPLVRVGHPLALGAGEAGRPHDPAAPRRRAALSQTPVINGVAEGLNSNHEHQA